ARARRNRASRMKDGWRIGFPKRTLHPEYDKLLLPERQSGGRWLSVVCPSQAHVRVNGSRRALVQEAKTLLDLFIRSIESLDRIPSADLAHLLLTPVSRPIMRCVALPAL